MPSKDFSQLIDLCLGNNSTHNFIFMFGVQQNMHLAKIKSHFRIYKTAITMFCSDDAGLRVHGKIAIFHNHIDKYDEACY